MINYEDYTDNKQKNFRDVYKEMIEQINIESIMPDRNKTMAHFESDGTIVRFDVIAWAVVTNVPEKDRQVIGLVLMKTARELVPVLDVPGTFICYSTESDTEHAINQRIKDILNGDEVMKNV